MEWIAFTDKMPPTELDTWILIGSVDRNGFGLLRLEPETDWDEDEGVVLTGNNYWANDEGLGDPDPTTMGTHWILVTRPE